MQTFVREYFDQGIGQPTLAPWFTSVEFRRIFGKGNGTSLIPPEHSHHLYTQLLQSLFIPGDVWECGVFRGGSAAMFAEVLRLCRTNPQKQLHLFDTFSGMPETRADKDIHVKGDFSETSVEEVKKTVGTDPFIHYHVGFMPDTFKGLEESKICFAHIDVDIYQSILDCCAFVYPRLAVGGFMLFDDYGIQSCPGARAAVDEYFSKRSVFPLILRTGQAIVFKNNDLPAAA